MKRVWSIIAAVIKGMLENFFTNSPLLTILGRYHWVILMHPHEFDVALHGVTGGNAAPSLSLVGHLCSRAGMGRLFSTRATFTDL